MRGVHGVQGLRRPAMAPGRTLLGALAAVVLASCSSNGADVRSSSAATSSTAVRATSTSGPTTTVAPTTSTTAAPVVEAVSSADVRAVQQRLAELGYDVGEPDGRFGGRTSYAIMAFQKIEGLSRTGDIDDGLQAALAGAS